jgi:hypothetical protein
VAQLVAAFGTSHSTMLFSKLENWQKLFDHVDCKAPVNDFDGHSRSFDELLKATPASSASKVSPEAIKERYIQVAEAMDRLETNIGNAKLDALIIVGDDQREIFKDACRPAIGVYYGEAIRNAAAPNEPTSDWYVSDQRRRLEDQGDRFYPCHAALASYLIEELMHRNFDVTAVKQLVGDQFEGHAYSFIHRRYMSQGFIPVVPIFLNTYYSPNQPSPMRCFNLGTAIKELVAEFPANIRVGVLASGGLSHFLVNEELDGLVTSSIRNRDFDALKRLPARLLNSGSSEIRNWIAVAAAASDLSLDWLSYVPGYRSRAMTGVGLCFAHWH